MVAVFVASIRVLLPEKMGCHQAEEFARCDDLGLLPEPWKVPHVPSHQVVGMGSVRAFEKQTILAELKRNHHQISNTARALGLDCGPMSGFDQNKLNAEFFPDGKWKSNFLCNLGYGDSSKLFPRGPRFDFNEACKIV